MHRDERWMDEIRYCLGWWHGSNFAKITMFNADSAREKIAPGWLGSIVSLFAGWFSTLFRVARTEMKFLEIETWNYIRVLYVLASYAWVTIDPELWDRDLNRIIIVIWNSVWGPKASSSTASVSCFHSAIYSRPNKQLFILSLIYIRLDMFENISMNICNR